MGLNWRDLLNGGGSKFDIPDQNFAASGLGFRGVGFTYLWLVGNGGMGYNYNYYYYHSSIPY